MPFKKIIFFQPEESWHIPLQTYFSPSKTSASSVRPAFLHLLTPSYLTPIETLLGLSTLCQRRCPEAGMLRRITDIQLFSTAPLRDSRIAAATHAHQSQDAVHPWPQHSGNSAARREACQAWCRGELTGISSGFKFTQTPKRLAQQLPCFGSTRANLPL